MIGVIGPLVQGKRELRGSTGSVALFALGAVGGAATTGALIALLGVLVGGRIPVIAVGAVGCGLLLVDLAFRTPTLRRQTCSTWYRDRGARSVWGLWGYDLGLGFSTIRLSSLYWLMVLVVAAFVPPWLAPLVLAFYGLGLGTAFVVALAAQAWSTPTPSASPGLGLLQAADRVRLVSVAFLGTVSVALIAWSALG